MSNFPKIESTIPTPAPITSYATAMLLNLPPPTVSHSPPQSLSWPLSHPSSLQIHLRLLRSWCKHPPPTNHSHSLNTHQEVVQSSAPRKLMPCGMVLEMFQR